MTSRDSCRHLSAVLLALCLGNGPAHAEAGDESVSEVGVIELPGDTPQQRRGFSLNWDCDVLLIEDSRRFRAGHCPGEQQAETATELGLEQAQESSEDAATPRRRKLIY